LRYIIVDCLKYPKFVEAWQ